MPRCFVIQPFDNDKYDDRFTDIFEPAIKAAALEPYRVDRDPAASIPIESIEEGIRNAAVCLAEITENNPNVWFELGYAIAAGVQVCMICAADRTAPFPFDVQHRKIIRYKSTTSSDFTTLGEKITERLKALLESRSEIAAIVKAPTKDGLTAHELTALTIIVSESDIKANGPSAYTVRTAMGQAGFNDLAASLAVRVLLRDGLIHHATVHPEENYGESYTAFTPTEAGVDFLLARRDELQLTKPRRVRSITPPDSPDDLPL